MNSEPPIKGRCADPVSKNLKISFFLIAGLSHKYIAMAENYFCLSQYLDIW
jgi:hypothetical protein